MDNVLSYYDFLLEEYKVDEAIMKKWNESKTLSEIKALLKRFYNPAFLKNFRGQARNELDKLKHLHDKYTAGDESVKPELLELGKTFIERRKKNVKKTASSFGGYHRY